MQETPDPRGSGAQGGSAAPIEAIARSVTACRICAEPSSGAPLPHEPRPIFQVSRTAPIVIASQAPGARAHASGVPFDDASGERLRQWLGLERERFYDRGLVSIVPMGFCFPGCDETGGDRPPRTACRLMWHDRLFAAMPSVELIICIGAHAARYHLARLGLAPDRPVRMGDVMARWRTLAEGRNPRLIVLPHPSWRNTAWLRRNPWFEADVLPVLRSAVASLIGSSTASGHSA